MRMLPVMPAKFQRNNRFDVFLILNSRGRANISRKKGMAIHVEVLGSEYHKYVSKNIAAPTIIQNVFLER